MGLLLYVLFTAATLAVFYFIVETAVKNGIDKSRLGKALAEKNGIELNEENKRASWLDDDLDN
ncbi:hypothetical protein GCM10010954_23130 [Halobacillus andaensis]|uniref:Uncharacterized protein n=1 Tax=Halobacillus andaensis TaxID=1176239 RepID=A0A917B5M7_HALAA|nr:hypothetical protein [Halobacillus andaensis]MBP2006096.1 hypothetical protein [Halobacillus andaensis]GGF23676.1 hypothetical protein GCM10010954_23130 [Halobacillus andaensis]